MTRTNGYSIYHLPVLSEMVLPELSAPETFCQVSESRVIKEVRPVSIRKGQEIQLSDIEKKPWFSANATNEAWLRHRQIGEMTIKDGALIEIRALPGADEDLIRLYLLGSAMGCILHQRGILPLHVSTIYINGQAWAFTAPSGTGKSTLAARLHRFANCPMVSDDVAALYVIDAQAYVAGGPPLVKLTPEFAAVFEGAAITPIPGPESNKLRVQTRNSFVSGLVPLAGIVVLERDESVTKGSLEIEPLSGAQAFIRAREAIYRHEMALAMSSPSLMFKKIIELASHLRFYRGRLGHWNIADGGATELSIADRLASISEQIL